MTPEVPRASLPKDCRFQRDEEYVTSLLTFATSCELFQTLCGGVHILDFLTKEPDLYSTLLPQEWRDWFDLKDISDILDLLMREDVSVLERFLSAGNNTAEEEVHWRNGQAPPASLLKYILSIRRHLLDRSFVPSRRANRGVHASLQRHVAVGMKPKKIHEVQNFAAYIDDFSEHITCSSPHNISHLVDFGSGQNYLGRALASPPFNKRVIALESKSLNIDGAKSMDVHARLAEKQKVMRNKKQYRSEINNDVPSIDAATKNPSCIMSRTPHENGPVLMNQQDQRITYMETLIQDGDLSQVVKCIPNIATSSPTSDPQLMVISLHSCGNLLHHGLRSLVLNPSVKAVAMVGCCYNLVTERLGRPTYKLPTLRSSNLRLDTTSSACDPHGFPMSETLATFKHTHGEGIRLNITARMMAVQAPQNWTTADSESFFTRHFYRALLQRIFLDRGTVSKPIIKVDEQPQSATSPLSYVEAGPPITIGSLRKACYASFQAYVRGALKKLSNNSDFADRIEQTMQGLTDDEIEGYSERYRGTKKALSIVWSLMAFSAGVVESIIVVDRWLYLREQKNVKECWVETVFDYAYSPRNLVVVGIKA